MTYALFSRKISNTIKFTARTTFSLNHSKIRQLLQRYRFSTILHCQRLNDTCLKQPNRKLLLMLSLCVSLCTNILNDKNSFAYAFSLRSHSFLINTTLFIAIQFKQFQIFQFHSATVRVLIETAETQPATHPSTRTFSSILFVSDSLTVSFGRIGWRFLARTLVGGTLR